jgi:pimeloyl-ACP methyl ester carboxylesterase
VPRAVFTPCHRGGAGPPLLLLHGFTDTWRSWELVLPALERRHDVLALTLAGHAGGPPLPGEITPTTLVEAVERGLDDAGLDTVHVVGNSLGGHVALQLAARGRARSVVALAPAGGWAEGDESYRETLDGFATLQEVARAGAPHADAIAATPDGRRQATAMIVRDGAELPPELVANLIRGVAACADVDRMIEAALRLRWPLDAGRIGCPVRMVWGTGDRILRWPATAARFRTDWLPHADWIVLDDVGHCPQLDAPLETAQLILGFTDR